MKDCPEYIVALLTHIESEIARKYWNKHQKSWSEYDGSGTEDFEWRPFYWGDDESEYEKPNFKYGDIEIHWYKHLGRGTTISRDVTPEEAVDMFNVCYSSAGQNWEDQIEQW